jgi:hypothetical protein
MLCHNYSGGAGGKGGELVDQINFEDEQIKSLMSQIYLGFLNPKELGLLFNDKDFRFNAKEIQERLLSRQKYLLKLQKQVEAESKPKAEAKTKAQPKPKKPKVVPEPDYDPKDVAFTKGKE